jgi:flagellar basal-body rod protein FlgG
MDFLSRAATGLFSLGLVSALLVGGHWIARSNPRPGKPARGRAVATAPAVFSQMPDCKMPECPPASGPLRGPKLTGIVAAGGEVCDHPLFSPATRAPTVIHATSGQGPSAELALPKVADASESSTPFPQPLPLPLRSNAIPLRPEGPELPTIGEPPASAPKFPGGSSPGRRIIDRALPNSSSEEREVWHDALKDLSPKDVRELLRLREELGRLPQSSFDSRMPMSQPIWTPSAPGPIASDPFHPSTESPGLLPDSGRDAARTIAASLDALAQAQQVLLNNVANANTDGYKRVAIAFESVTNSAGGPGGFGVGVRLAPKTLDMSSGKLRHTDRPLDLAIDGEGFFQLEDPRSHQAFYTRSGRFAVNAKGEMVWRTSQRELLLRPAVKIAAPESDVEIATNGTVEAATEAGGSGRDASQRIVIVRLPALADLVPTGENLFAIRGELHSPGTLGSDPLAGRVRQGCLEESNVDVDRELRELEGLRRQARALETAAQSQSLAPREFINAAGEPPTMPSHVAGSAGADRH